jgi:hypothetical protein
MTFLFWVVLFLLFRSVKFLVGTFYMCLTEHKLKQKELEPTISAQALITFEEVGIRFLTTQHPEKPILEFIFGR